MRIKFPSKKLNGVTAYATAKSSDKTKEYTVVKQKTIDGGVNYRCSCPAFMFRGIQCKHIMALKESFAAITHGKR